MEIHQTDEHGVITARDTYESKRNMVKCLSVERLQADSRKMVQFTADEINMVYQYRENGQSGTLDLFRQIQPRIKDPSAGKVVRDTVSKLSFLTKEVCSGLISSTKNRKINERDCSIKERLARAKEEVKQPVTDEGKSKEMPRRKHGEQTATVYTADKAVMRRFDSLVTEYPEMYQLVEQTRVSKTYSMPKSYVSYRKPRQISEEQKKIARQKMKAINESRL